MLLRALSVEVVHADSLSAGPDEDYRGKIVLVKGGIRLKVARQLPEHDCQTLFDSLCNAYQSCGYSPIVTFCSFDQS